MDKNELFATMPVPQALRRMIIPAAVSQIIVLGAVPTVLSNVMSSLVRSIGHSREAGFGVTLGAVLNIVLDPVFMYWILPDGQQVLGVGLATLVSNCVSFLYFLGILWEIRSCNLLTADPRAGLPRRKTLVAVLGVGIPSATTSLLFDLDYMVVDKLMVAYSAQGGASAPQHRHRHLPGHGAAGGLQLRLGGPPPSATASRCCSRWPPTCAGAPGPEPKHPNNTKAPRPKAGALFVLRF